jgi:hypothetical protein
VRPGRGRQHALAVGHVEDGGCLLRLKRPRFVSMTSRDLHLRRRDENSTPGQRNVHFFVADIDGTGLSGRRRGESEHAEKRRRDMKCFHSVFAQRRYHISVIRLLRYLWAGPTTIASLVFAVVLLKRGHLALVDGVVEAHGPLLCRALKHLTPLDGHNGAAAITLGHVVIGRSARVLEKTREHERAHVRQYELWGPFFVPAYLLAGLWALVCGHDPYLDNPFEREARSNERSLTPTSWIDGCTCFVDADWLRTTPGTRTTRNPRTLCVTIRMGHLTPSAPKQKE